MRNSLNEGYKLINEKASQSSYTILSVMGEGGSCISYLAKMDSTDNECVIKEYYPLSLSLERNESGTLLCPEIEQEKYNLGIKHFIDATDNQIRLRLFENTSNQTFYVIDRFKANNTYYVITPRFNGETYKNNLEISLYDRVRVCRSVADYVRRCHMAGYLCLDIKPDNIFVVPETPEFVMFFDYDSVCKASDISFGKTSSYTEKWAAPEQLLPGAYESISFQTDIYILGELIFWSVFDRHSTEEEHRRNSKYKFQEIQYSDDISDDAKESLEEIFHNTLRSSVGNRYDSVDQLIVKIDELLVKLYPRNESIVSLLPAPTSFFVGRENEIEIIETKLRDEKKVFLSGVGGIGKSEIAKQYVYQFKEEYRSIIYLTYTVDLVSTINNAFFITDFEQKEEETDIHYCNRKINKLSELYSGRNLIVIDNLNIEIEDIDYREIWQKICALPCELIITTRCNQEAYYKYQIYIDGLKTTSLEEIYNYYCKYGEEQRGFVEDIISAVHGHTLVVELIARQTRSSMKTPEEMLQVLEEKGILGLGTETVKWDLRKGTVSDHVKGLFTISNISDEQRQIMYMMAFMPLTGVDVKLFFEFYEADNYSDLRYLIDNGWISESLDSSRRISMHPVIRSVVIDELLDNRMLANDVFVRSINAMVVLSKNDSINEDEFYAMCKSIAIQISMWNFEVEKAADYLSRYVNSFAKYGNSEERRKYLLKSIAIYDSVYGTEEYVAVREYAYNSYVELINDVNHVSEVKDLCERHLWKAKENKDLFMQGIWYTTMTKAAFIRNYTKSNFSLMYVPFFFKLINIYHKMKDASGKIKPLITHEYLESLHYDYLLELNLSETLYLNMASCLERLSYKKSLLANGW